MKELIDTAIPSKDFGLVIVVGGRMLIYTTIGLTAGFGMAHFSSIIAMGVGRNLRSKVYEKVISFSQAEIDSFSTSSLITRTNSDINQVQIFLSNCLSIAFIAPVLCIIGLIMAMITSPSLACVLAIAVPILIILIAIIGKYALPLSEIIQDKLDQINMVIREKLTGVRVIRAFGTNEFEEKRFDKINMEYTTINKKLQNATNFFRPVIVLVLAFVEGGIMFIAFHQNVTAGVAYTTGEVMAVIQYVTMIMASIMMMTIVFLLMPRASTCAKRAQEILDSVNEIQSPVNPKDSSSKGYLEFRNVSFTYAGADVPAVKDLSFSAKPGEITAIIGGTGMGKSSIVNLIPRLYDVTQGQVLVDGIDVRDYNLEDLRSKIGFVPQKALLFRGTIDSNLAFGDENPTEERIEEAVKIAQSYDFVTKKEKGFASPVSQGGTNFSGGQRQRLCIARAIVRKPEIYVFDDSFSALDFKTDKELRAALRKEAGESATTVIVAQRVSTIMDADRIIVIEQGEIAGIGTHAELLENCTVYREIVESQMSKEETGK
ncbi:MAG: ABC transporter ATP-binding protein [Bacillota bacterium]|nr:ABC transporter ATP-binding protein [Bacillota bacterium]